MYCLQIYNFALSFFKIKKRNKIGEQHSKHPLIKDSFRIFITFLMSQGKQPNVSFSKSMNIQIFVTEVVYNLIYAMHIAKTPSTTDWLDDIQTQILWTLRYVCIVFLCMRSDHPSTTIRQQRQQQQRQPQSMICSCNLSSCYVYLSCELFKNFSDKGCCISLSMTTQPTTHNNYYVETHMYPVDGCAVRTSVSAINIL